MHASKTHNSCNLLCGCCEKFDLKPGFFTFSNLKQGEKLIDRYKYIPGCFNSRTSVIDKLLNIPAIYWGDIDTKSQDKTKM